MCAQPSFKKDNKALSKFLQFDTKANILCGNKTRRALLSFIVCRSEFVDLQGHAFTANSDAGFATLCDVPQQGAWLPETTLTSTPTLE